MPRVSRLRRSAHSARTIALVGSCCCLFARFAIAAAPSDRPDADDKADVKPVVEPQAKAKERRFYMAVGIGTDFDTGATRFSREAPVPFFLPVLVGFPFGGGPFTYPYNAKLHTLRYSDVYPYRFTNTFYRPQIEFGFVASQCLEVFGTFAYTHATARDRLTIGEVNTITTDTSGSPNRPPDTFGRIPVTGSFGDYRSYGGELGLRWFLPLRLDNSTPLLRPYLSASAGATYVDSISQRIDDSGSVIGSFRGTAYHASWLGTGAILAGLELKLTPAFSLTLDAGLRYASELSQPAGAVRYRTYASERLQNSGDRLFCPLTLMAKVRF
jgi:hypothetical protein